MADKSVNNDLVVDSDQSRNQLPAVYVSACVCRCALQLHDATVMRGRGLRANAMETDSKVDRAERGTCHFPPKSCSLSLCKSMSSRILRRQQSALFYFRPSGLPDSIADSVDVAQRFRIMIVGMARLPFDERV